MATGNPLIDIFSQLGAGFSQGAHNYAAGRQQVRENARQDAKDEMERKLYARQTNAYDRQLLKQRVDSLVEQASAMKRAGQDMSPILPAWLKAAQDLDEHDQRPKRAGPSLHKPVETSAFDMAFQGGDHTKPNPLLTNKGEWKGQLPYLTPEQIKANDRAMMGSMGIAPTKTEYVERDPFKRLEKIDGDTGERTVESEAIARPDLSPFTVVPAGGRAYRNDGTYVEGGPATPAQTGDMTEAQRVQRVQSVELIVNAERARREAAIYKQHTKKIGEQTRLDQAGQKKLAELGAQMDAYRNQLLSQVEANPTSPQSQGGAGVSLPGVKPEYQALASYLSSKYGLTPTSGKRSTEKQAQLYKQLGPSGAAAPGTSAHEFGEGVDFVGSPGALQKARDEVISAGGFAKIEPNGSLHIGSDHGKTPFKSPALNGAMADFYKNLKAKGIL